MYTRRNYSFWMTIRWSSQPLLLGLLYAFLVTSIYYFLEIDISLPWQLISVIGIAVAFYLGFKNNSSYDRTWEARKIWGAIVNNSRTFGSAVVSFIQSDNDEELKSIRRRLIYRHIAWMTALRYQLRLSREWEHTKERMERYVPVICEAYFDKLDKELVAFLSAEEVDELKNKANLATHILTKQAIEIQRLRDLNYIDAFRHKRFHEIIGSLFDEQGKCERIKNFPFPRQYASTALWLTYVLCALLPFGILNTLGGDIDGIRVWLTAPLSAMTTWVFFLTEKIGDYSENPFEGTYNDVPITTIARTIEIDLREMIGDESIPPAFVPENGFLL